MGGGYYDREVISSTTQATTQATTHATTTTTTTASTEWNKEWSKGTELLLEQNTQLHKSMEPKKWINEELKSESKHPIVFVLDITGSMGNWPKIIYDKMPMFYGQIMTQGYLTDPSLGICAIGDAYTDKAPLQVTEFGKGKEIDQLIAKLYIEDGGGGNHHESYELAAYFYSHYCTLKNHELPFMFITGDEHFYPTLPSTILDKTLGIKSEDIKDTKVLWKQLTQKFNVFHIHKHYYKNDAQIKKEWGEVLGDERVFEIQTPKAVVDLVLGVIAISSGARNLQTYVSDMEARGQDQSRIEEVSDALKLFNSTFNKKKILRNEASVGNIMVVKNEEEKKEELPKIVDSSKFDKIKPLIEKKQHTTFLNSEDSKYRDDLKKLTEKLKDKIPTEFICPFTKEIMFDPVKIQDGSTYDRAAIEVWFEDSNVSPDTSLVLSSPDLVPNDSLKALIKSFLESNANLVQ